MKYRIINSVGTMTHLDSRWYVYENGLFHSTHHTWAEAMKAVEEALRVRGATPITVTLPPYRDEYITEDTGGVFVEDCLKGWASIGYTAGGMWVALAPEEVEPVALALLAIDRHNKEKKP